MRRGAWVAAGVVVSASALAAQPKPEAGDLPSADVVARRVMDRTPAEVIAAFADLRHASGLFDGDCLRRWGYGSPTAGPGARARVSYVPGPLNRRLTVVVDEVVPGVRVTWDHPGPKGFVTRVTAKPAPGGTEVVLQTFLEAPHWFVRHTYHEVIQPLWTQCYVDALERLAGPAGAPARVAPVATPVAPEPPPDDAPVDPLAPDVEISDAPGASAEAGAAD